MTSRVLVTGGNGFLGRYVCERLTEDGVEPVVLDRYRDAGETEYDTILGDIRDATAVTDAVAHVDAVIHLAGVLGTQETIANPRPAVETNVLGGLNVLEACAQYDVPLVNIAVGNSGFLNTYSISKTTVEHFAQMFVKERGATVAIVRALNAYGPRQVAAAPFGPSKVRKIAPSFICRALASEPIEIYGDGSQVMDMIHARDVADVLVRAVGHSSPDVLQAGTGRRTTVNDIAKAVIAEVGGGEIVYLPMRPGEPERSVVLGDPSTLAPLGIDADQFTTLEAGIAETVAWYRR